MKSYRYLNFITASLVAVLLISNITAAKVVTVGGLVFDGGTLLFPVSYIFGDILTEVYGYKASRRVIWTGFFWMFIAALMFQIVVSLPAAADYTMQDAFAAILGQTPRILLASLTGYFTGEFANSYVLARLKVRTSGRYLWVRTIGSTIIGEGADTLVFVLIAFTGAYSADTLSAMLLSNYVFKVGIEAAFTPLTYAIVNALKRAEQSDVFDTDTDFNPLAIGDA